MGHQARRMTGRVNAGSSRAKSASEVSNRIGGAHMPNVSWRNAIVGSVWVWSKAGSAWLAPGRIVRVEVAPALSRASLSCWDWPAGTLQSASPWASENAGTVAAVAR